MASPRKSSPMSIPNPRFCAKKTESTRGGSSSHGNPGAAEPKERPLEGGGGASVNMRLPIALGQTASLKGRSRCGKS